MINRKKFSLIQKLVNYMLPHKHRFKMGDILNILNDPQCVGCPIRLSEVKQETYPSLSTMAFARSNYHFARKKVGHA